MEAKTGYNKALKLIQRSNWVLCTALSSTDGWPDHSYRTNFANIKKYPSLAKKIDYKKLENYFPINKYSTRLQSVLDCPKVTLYFYDITTGETCQLKGKINIVNSPKKRMELWQEEWEKQFADGPTDEEYVLLHFQAVWLQYYDGHSDSFWGLLTEAFSAKEDPKPIKNTYPAYSIDICPQSKRKTKTK